MVPLPRASEPASAASRLTAVFAKEPRPGEVKTRLTPPLDPGRAAALAEAMLRDAVARCTACPAFRTALWFVPVEGRAWFERTFGGLELVPQVGPGLAERLAAAFDDGLGRAGVRTMVAIGSDQPLLATARIAAAHELLERGADLVLAPDLGGGYALVGLRAPCPELFTRVAMSTASVLEETLALARGRALEVRQLPAELDVDRIGDLDALEERLAGRSPEDPDYPRETARCLAELRVAPDRADPDGPRDSPHSPGASGRPGSPPARRS